MRVALVEIRAFFRFRGQKLAAWSSKKEKRYDTLTRPKNAVQRKIELPVFSKRRNLGQEGGFVPHIPIRGIM